MRIEDLLRYKISVHDNINTKNIISNRYYFKWISDEYKILDEKKHYDFSMYAYDNIELEIDMYNLTNIEDYHNYVDESDKKHSEFLIEIENETIDEKYYIEDYKNIPIIKHTDNIFKRYDSLESDITNNEIDRYKEVDNFINYIKYEFSNISLNKIQLDIIESLLHKKENYTLTAKEIFGRAKPNKNEYIIWESFKSLLDEELRILHYSIKNEVENYTYSEEVPEEQNKINEILTENDAFAYWDNIFEEKYMYDKFIEIFTNYSLKKEYDKSFKITTKKRIKTRLSKALRQIYSETSDRVLREDIQYFELLKQIDVYNQMNNNEIYRLLMKN